MSKSKRKYVTKYCALEGVNVNGNPSVLGRHSSLLPRRNTGIQEFSQPDLMLKS
jgi:hypothetical protein